MASFVFSREVVFWCAGASVVFFGVGFLAKGVPRFSLDGKGGMPDPIHEGSTSMNELVSSAVASVEAKPTSVAAGPASTSRAVNSSKVKSSSPVARTDLRSGAAATQCAAGGRMFPFSGEEPKQRCATFFDELEGDLVNWLRGIQSSRLLNGWRQSFKNGPSKLAYIHWDGIGRLTLYTRDVKTDKGSLTKPNVYSIAAKLIADLARRVRLPAVEFLYSPTDKCPPLAHSTPLFVLAKNNSGRGILFPSITRPVRPRLIWGPNNSSMATWGHDFLPAILWEQKKNDVFYRGSLVGVKDKKVIAKREPKIDICCMGRGTKKPKSNCPVNVGLTCSSEDKHPVCRTCGAHRAPYASGAMHKFLAIPPGNGYTGRFRDYLAFESVNIKQYKNHLIEWYERGLVHGHKGHLLDVSGQSHTAFLNAVDWAYTNDAISKKIGQRGSAYVRWALSDETVLCFVWKLLTAYIRLLNYSYRDSIFKHVVKGATGFPLERGLQIPRKKNYHHYETDVVPPSEQDHLKFVRDCESREQVPHEAQSDIGE